MTTAVPQVTNKWPADPVLNVENGLPTSPPSRGPERGASPTHQDQGLGDFQIRLLAALTAQTQAMLGLTSRIDRLIDAMGEGEDIDPDALPTAYLDGSPIR